jgi:2-oxoisovalerate dehydrogenase E1 component alpha subunit
MIEAMTYRRGHHSTSDDSSRYRDADEVRVATDVSIRSCVSIAS